MNKSSEVITLKALMGDYPNTSLLRKGEISSPGLVFEFADVKVPNNAFKRVVRDLEFDVAELAITTYLTAKAHHKPLVLLPIVLKGKFQHESIVCRATEPSLTPADLVGRRVGIRAYSVTTVAWVRGILQNEYSVDLGRVKWVTFEDSHVAEVQEPVGFERAPAGKTPMAMLLAGELDAIVATDNDLKDPRVRPVIADPEAASQKWFQRCGVVPINHMVVVKESLMKSNPWVAKEVFRLLSESKKAAGLPTGTGPDRTPLGVEANRKSLEMIVKYAAQQRLIPRQFEVDELFNDVTRSSGE
jgi:4,5-dihydroxyphthalate decarboxylase